MRKLIPLTKETIDAIFKEALHQADYALALYRHVIPQWDDIGDVQGYPAVSSRTADYIMGKAMEFDRLHHPGVLNGGLWLNVGFSFSAKVKDWMVDMRKVRLMPLGAAAGKESA